MVGDNEGNPMAQNERLQADQRSRREILRAGLLAGAAFWTAGAITSVPRALAEPECDETGCLGTAWGLSQNVKAPTVYPATPASACPGGCGFNVDLNQPGPPDFARPVVASSGAFCGCHSFEDGTCRSEGSIESVELRVWRGLFWDPIEPTGHRAPNDLVVTADLLSSTTETTCECTVERNAQTKNVRFIEPRTGTYYAVSDAAPNTVIWNDGVVYPGFRIVANERGCAADGSWFTAALHIRLPAEVLSRGFGRHIYLGYSSARNDSCGNCVA